MSRHPAKRNGGVFPLLLWRSPPSKTKSAKIVPATAARSWLFPKISANPLFTLAEKRRFYRPKLPALRAEVDGLAQKSARLFSCFAACGFSLCRNSLADVLFLLLAFLQHSRTPAQRPVLWLPAGTRSAVSGKPHKSPTRARRRGTRCRSQLHLHRGRFIRHFLALQPVKKNAPACIF